MTKYTVLFAFLIVLTLVVAGCSSGTSTNPEQRSKQTLTTALSSPVQKPLISASLNKAGWKETDIITIKGEATRTPSGNVDIVIHKCQDSLCKTFDPGFPSRTFHPVVSENKYTQTLNAAEFGPGEFHADITVPSTDLFTKLRFYIEE